MGMHAGMPVQTSVVVISVAVYNTALTLSAYTLALITTTLIIPAPAALFCFHVSIISCVPTTPTEGAQTYNIPKLKLPAISIFSRRGR